MISFWRGMWTTALWKPVIRQRPRFYPLGQDDRSLTRLPNKMGEYLASGRPVISCEIGDLTNFLIDNVNAY